MPVYETSWRCLESTCPQGGSGPASEADKAAEKHVKTAGHGTMTTTQLVTAAPG